mgnify:CR=1 FL=1
MTAAKRAQSYCSEVQAVNLALEPSTKYVIKRINKKQIDRGYGTLLIYVEGAPDQTITQGWPAIIKLTK